MVAHSHVSYDKRSTIYEYVLYKKKFLCICFQNEMNLNIYMSRPQFGRSESQANFVTRKCDPASTVWTLCTLSGSVSTAYTLHFMSMNITNQPRINQHQNLQGRSLLHRATNQHQNLQALCHQHENQQILQSNPIKYTNHIMTLKMGKSSIKLQQDYHTNHQTAHCA